MIAKSSMVNVRMAREVFRVKERLTVRQQLQGNHVHKALQTIDSSRHSDSSYSGVNGLVILVADNDCEEDSSESVPTKWQLVNFTYSAVLYAR